MSTAVSRMDMNAFAFAAVLKVVAVLLSLLTAALAAVMPHPRLPRPTGAAFLFPRPLPLPFLFPLLPLPVFFPFLPSLSFFQRVIHPCATLSLLWTSSGHLFHCVAERSFLSPRALAPSRPPVLPVAVVSLYLQGPHQDIGVIDTTIKAEDASDPPVQIRILYPAVRTCSIHNTTQHNTTTQHHRCPFACHIASTPP